jgi:hypothetical protein
MTTLVTQPAALRRRALASAPMWACQPVVASAAIAAVGPTGVFGAAQGSGMSAAGYTTPVSAAHTPSIQLTDKTPAVAANDGALGYHAHRRPPA